MQQYQATVQAWHRNLVQGIKIAVLKHVISQHDVTKSVETPLHLKPEVLLSSDFQLGKLWSNQCTYYSPQMKNRVNKDILTATVHKAFHTGYEPNTNKESVNPLELSFCPPAYPVWIQHITSPQTLRSQQERAQEQADCPPLLFRTPEENKIKWNYPVPYSEWRRYENWGDEDVSTITRAKEQPMLHSPPLWGELVLTGQVRPWRGVAKLSTSGLWNPPYARSANTGTSGATQNWPPPLSHRQVLFSQDSTALQLLWEGTSTL